MTDLKNVDEKMKYFRQREADTVTLQKMIEDLELGTYQQEALISNIADFAYKMGIRHGEYMEKYLNK